MFYFQKSSVGSALYEKVFLHLDLIEIDYFGLQFVDSLNVKVSTLKITCEVDMSLWLISIFVH